MDGACDLELLLYTLVLYNTTRATFPEEHVRLIEDMNGPMVACEGRMPGHIEETGIRNSLMRMRKWKLCFVNPLREEINKDP